MIHEMPLVIKGMFEVLVGLFMNFANSQAC